MKKLIGRVVGPLGILFVVFGLLSRVFVTGEWNWVVLTQVALGLVGMAIYAATAVDELRNMATGRGSLFVVTSVVTTALLLVVVVAVNYAASVSRKEWDLTKEGIHTLSEQTTAMLTGLTADTAVNVTAFFRSTDQEYAPVEELLRRYKNIGGEHFTFDFVDPVKNPKKAKEMAVSATSPRIIVKAKNGKESRAKEPTEESLTNALAEVNKGAEKVLYFLTNHGEKPTGKGNDTPAGLKLWADGLASEGYRTQELSLLAQKDVPDDALGVVIVGPQAPYMPEESAALQRYADKGGRFVIALDPGVDHGLGSLIESWGVEQMKGTIVDPASQQPLWAFTQEFSEHPIAQPTRSLFGALAFVFPDASGIRNKGAEGYTVTELFKTGKDAWGEMGSIDGQTEVSRDANDEPGPIPLGAAVTKKLDGDKEFRAVIFGDSEFCSNGFIRQGGNRDLSLNAVQWLGGQETKITIRPKMRAKSSVSFLTADQRLAISFFSLNALPLLLFAVGFTVHNLRRR